MIEDHQLKTFRDLVASAFKAGTAHFPHYTLHGQEHLNELDRLCLLICGAIPPLENDEINLLRLAIIMHDYAMVDVPDQARENELRQQMDLTLSFADIVRKNHQDEIVQSLTKKSETLFDTFTAAEVAEIDAAITIARHHRFHNLEEAPDHLKGLCALMRLLDELDIGPARAPRAAYDSLSSRMDNTSRFHWLKHICCGKVERNTTFFLEEKDGRNILKIWVAILATENSWPILQKHVLDKLQECMEADRVADILLEKYNVKIEIGAMREKPSLCGVAQVLPPKIREDLDAVTASPPFNFETPQTTIPSSENGTMVNETVDSASLEHVLPQEEPVVILVSGDNSRLPKEATPSLAPLNSERQLRLIAIPPDQLFEQLSLASRLSVIENTYIPREEQSTGGKIGAPNRIYLGPADCGKTRSAAEWIHEITQHHPANWVVLRTEQGDVPRDVDKNIILDRSLYGECGLPQNAILFLDDLPGNLPPSGSEQDASEAIRRLLAWFNALPYFHNRRFLGTIRLEDLQSKPNWPAVLPTLGSELELLRLADLKESEYIQLWRGMKKGKIFISMTEGQKDFSLNLNEDFILAASKRSTNPEGVAQFIFETARQDQHKQLNVNDAKKFHDSAAETWLNETWPALHKNYGVIAQAFHTIARFLEGGLRPKSGFTTVLPPAWEYHVAFGQDLCERTGKIDANYLKVIAQMGHDGHASGQKNSWIRPRWDYLLQAKYLPGVEVKLPKIDWFEKRALRLPVLLRHQLATHLTLRGWLLESDIQDGAWLGGIAEGKLLLAETETNENTRKRLRQEAIDFYSKCISFSTKNDSLEEKEFIAIAILNKGKTLVELERPHDAIKAYDEVITRFAEAEELALQEQVAKALLYLGITRGRLKKPKDAIKTFDELITHFGKSEALALHKPVAKAFVNKGVMLRKLSKPKEAIKTYDKVIERFGKSQAIALQEQVANALVNKGNALGQLTKPEEAIKEYDEVIERFGKSDAIALHVPIANALFNKGVALGKLTKPEEAIKTYDELIVCFKNSETITLQELVANVLVNKGLTLGKLTKPEDAIKAFNEVIHRFGNSEGLALQEQVANAYSNRAVTFSELWRKTNDTTDLKAALESARRGVDLGATHYNLACMLALSGELEEAFEELSGCLEREEIAWAHVDGDPENNTEPDDDWDGLRGDERYLSLRARYGKAAD